MNNINDLQEQFENLIKQGQELLEKMKETQIADVSKTKRWKPKDGDVYYGVVADGTIKRITWNDDIIDYGYYKLGNCFETDEEAQKELDRRFAEQELLDMCDGSSDDDYWVEINYDKDTDLFETGQYGRMVGNCYHFASGKSAQKAIETLGTEKLKLIFRIED